MFESIFAFVLDSIKNLSSFTSFLFQPLGHGINIAPIALFSISGFTVILVFHIVHLVNPLG